MMSSVRLNRDQSGKILVIDDDELVRELTVSSSKRSVFRHECKQWPRRLALYRLHQPFSVVIVDMIMPEQGGESSFKHQSPQPKSASSFCVWLHRRQSGRWSERLGWMAICSKTIYGSAALQCHR